MHREATRRQSDWKSEGETELGGGGLGRRQGLVYAGLAKDLGWILSKTRSLWGVLSKG